MSSSAAEEIDALIQDVAAGEWSNPPALEWDANLLAVW